MKLPKSAKQLVESLKRLPGIGDKTALRLTLFIIDELDIEDVSTLSEALIKVKTDLSFCEICGSLMETICPICSDSNRDKDTIMVVETIKDLLVLEGINSYYGQYHVLGGTIDFSRGIEPEDLNINSLIKRAKDTKEIILALNGAVDGQLTSNYLQELLKDKDVIVSKIAHGLPIGADLSFADTKTLTVALNNRIKINRGD